jgi:hypothetical protein
MPLTGATMTVIDATETFAKRRGIIEEKEREWLGDAIGLHRLRRMPFVTLHDDGSPATWWNDVPTKGGIKAIHADRRRGEEYADMVVDALVADDAKGCIPLWLVINAIVDDAIKRRAKGSRKLPPAVHGFLTQLSLRMTDRFCGRPFTD